ncbi:hypothetical protein [Streptacidiphilus neutrinimicus]|uniref:hypothetical protein n=1 Tax=Streptacidiphilus neutrinimicus TaxID=105420 RepID=UPI0005A86479|nr:hypothetical protein [Streptacidiphilus neutrinimicus]
MTAFTVVVLTGLLLFLAITADLGQALAAKVQALGEAQDAARAGAQALDLGALRSSGTVRLRPDAAAQDARAYLAKVGAVGSVTVGTDTVSVAVTRTVPTHLLTLVGISSLTVHAGTTARAEQSTP